jgi:hypothetical protein
MPVARRSNISLKKNPAFTVTRVSVGDERLVYAMIADKKFDYPKGRSKVAYIGTTKNGIFRVTGSVAERANDILKLHGVESFDVRIITCPRRKHVKMWYKLEHAFIVAFREHYGAPPKCNDPTDGKNPRTVFNFFSKSRVKRVLDDLA